MIIHKNIEECNPNLKNFDSIRWFYLIANILSNKKLNPIVTEQ